MTAKIISIDERRRKKEREKNALDEKEKVERAGKIYNYYRMIRRITAEKGES